MSNRTFRASVSPAIISKADRFFNKSFQTIVNELLQNARRAGASRLDITTNRLDASVHNFIFADDGPGIDNPETLLTLGSSEWDDSLKDAEDPAGMGFFALAGVGCKVSSKDWSLTLTPDMFLGKEDILVETIPPITGTRIEFIYNQDYRYCKNIVGRAAMYYPLYVYFNGRRVDQLDYLHNALLVENYQGLRIGIFDGNVPSGTINFFGLICRAGIPAIKDLPYSVHIDVTDANQDLRLKLPDRSEVVQDEFFYSLKEHIETLLYNAILIYRNGQHDLSFKDYQRAHELGVNLPEAQPKLMTMYALANDAAVGEFEGTADNVPTLLDSAANYARIEPCMVESLEQTFGFIAGINCPAITLVAANDKYRGYQWYKNMPRVTEYYLVAHDENGKEVILADATCSSMFIRNSLICYKNRPKDIHLRLVITDKAGGESDYECPVDFVIKNNDCAYGEAHEFCISEDFISRCNGCVPYVIWNALTLAFFSYDCDWDDSYDTCKDRFNDELDATLKEIFVGTEAAARMQIEEAVRKLTAYYPQCNAKEITIDINNPSKPVLVFA